jgi:hypothetical protein
LRKSKRLDFLRHSFASWLAQDPEAPLAVLRDILGHSNLSVTSKYAHLQQTVVVKATARLKVISIDDLATNQDTGSTNSRTSEIASLQIKPRKATQPIDINGARGRT